MQHYYLFSHILAKFHSHFHAYLSIVLFILLARRAKLTRYLYIFYSALTVIITHLIVILVYFRVANVQYCTRNSRYTALIDIIGFNFACLIPFFFHGCKSTSNRAFIIVTS